MHDELISAILLRDDKLHLILASGGRPSYQYIYREARSVYWEPGQSSFRCSRSSTGLSLLELFRHMVDVIHEFGLALSFSPKLAFEGVPDPAVESIRAEIGVYQRLGQSNGESK